MMNTKRMAGVAFEIALLLLFATATQASAIISEIYYDAPGTDDGQLFVELSGVAGANLDGLVLEGVNGGNGAVGPTIVLTGSIGQDGLFVVADRLSDGSTMVFGADLLANFDFQNGPDSVILRQGATILDAVGYGVFAAGEIFAGEGMSAPDVSPGSSLARLFANVDSDDNATDFIVLSMPTPGVADFSAIPEPGAALLLGLGLFGLAAGGRVRIQS